MNIKNLLKEKGATIQLKYYGGSDWATGWDVKAIIDNSQLIIEYYKEKENSINNTDDLIDAFMHKKINRMSEVLPNIKSDDNREVLARTIALIGKSEDRFPVSDFLKFIGSQPEIVLLSEDRDLIIVAEDFCADYANTINARILEILISKCWYYVIDNFNAFQNRLLRNKEILELLFTEDKIEVCFQYRHKEVYGIITKLYNNADQPLKVVLGCVIPLLLDHDDKVYSKLSVENVMNIHHDIYETLSFLMSIKHSRTKDYSQLMQRADELLDQHLNRHGMVYEYRISETQINKLFESNSIPWDQKILLITHGYDQSMSKWVSIFKILNNQKTSSIIDFCATNIRTNSFFTASFQQTLNGQMVLGYAHIYALFRNEMYYEEFQKYYDQAVKLILDSFEVHNDDVLIEFQILKESVWNMINNDQNSHEHIYFTSMISCALTEKLLGIILQHRCSEFISDATLTLGGILSNKRFREVINDFIDDEYATCLEYFLCTNGEERVGHNWRNNLAHMRNITFNDINKSLAIQCFYLLLGVVNSLLSNLIKE